MKQKQRQATRIKLAFVYITGCSLLLVLLLTIWFCIDHSKKVAAANLKATVSMNHTSKAIVDSISSLQQTELLSFNAKRNIASILITWSTASEKNNHYFTIERSENGKTFRELAKVESLGKKSSARDYLFTDIDAPLAKTYYRLKQTDHLGNESVFRTIAVYAKVKTVTINSLTPNPFADQFNIALYSEKEKNILISLYNIQGNALKTRPFKIQEGSNLLVFKPGCYVAPGVYIVKVFSDNQLVASSKISCRE